MPEDQGWKCGWEDARKRALIAGLRATPAQRLEWLEKAIRLAHALGALPRRAPTSSRGRR